jgi:hypothetical protein
MTDKIETFTVQNQEGKRIKVEKWVQSFAPLAGATHQVYTYNLEETGEILRRHPASPSGFENIVTGELYVRVDR